MTSDDMKKCPYCAELIGVEAIKCHFCGSKLNGEKKGADTPLSKTYWRRINKDKRFAGVCTGLVHEFNTPQLLLPLRLFFILTTFFYGLGLILYITLWLLMSPPDDKHESLKQAPAVTAVTEENELPVPDYRKQVTLLDTVIGLLISATGVILTVASIGRSGFVAFSSQPYFRFPKFINDVLFFNINWITGMWPVLIAFGLMLIFFGFSKVLRIGLGCGLIALGSVFMILFIPFLPDMLMFPGMMIIGVMLFLIGIIKLAHGSKKIGKEMESSNICINTSQSSGRTPETSESIADE